MYHSAIVVVLVALCVMSTCLSMSCNTTKRIGVYSQDDRASCVPDINMTYSLISDLKKTVINCSTVYFCSHQLLLNESVRLANLHDVTLIGSSQTILNCNGLYGFEFVSMINLKVTALEFSGCIGNHIMQAFHFEAGIYINDSTNLAFTNVTVSNSTGMGMSVFETRGSVIFSGCTFRNNGNAKKIRGSTGVFIEINQATNRSSFKFDHCHFVGNRAYEINQTSTPFGRGGGLRIYINSASFNNVSIDHCTFSDNIASKWGGGLFVSIHDPSRENSIVIQNTNFSNNTSHMSGGATSVGFECSHKENRICLKNTFLFQSCHFINNSAVFGGGSLFSSTPINNASISSNKIKYIDCIWMHNSGHFGSAIIILSGVYSFHSEGVRPTPELEDCTIVSNYIQEGNLSSLQLPAPYIENSMGVGALYCTLHDIKFIGKLNVTDNNGSAMVTTSCYLSFQEHSTVSFHDNTGYFGGAMYLLGVSTISIQQNSLFEFINNRADADGGAIYYRNADIFEHEYSYNCFIRINRKTRKNISFIFSGNHAGVGSLAKSAHGQSIYALSLSPCVREYSNSNLTAVLPDPSFLNKIANFTFDNISRNEISTEVSTFMINSSAESSEDYFPVIPGKGTKIPFIGLDDLNQTRSQVYRLTLKKDANSSIDVGDHYSYVVHKKIKLYGRPGAEGTLMLTTTKQYKISLTFKVRLQDCPPGYILLNNSCTCSAESTTPYVGIDLCDRYNFQAYREEGYWCGYLEDKSQNEKQFVTGYCPTGFCQRSGFSNPLPPYPDANLLRDSVCKTSRKGILCSECVNGKSVYYHSPSFECGNKDKCHLGLLFYILTDIIPVTIIFIIIVTFNISFTSGLASGFIFYAQVIDCFQVSIYDTVQVKTAGTLNRVSSMFYAIFNLQFFNLDEISYCLAKSSSALDMLVLPFASFFYAFLLIFLIIFILKVCDTRRTKLFFKLRIHKIQTSIVHGMSAFLILCYAQCAKITFNLLSYGLILGKNGEIVKIVVYEDGRVDWFGPEHLKYAIPAVTFGLLIMFIPMIALFLYPLCYKCLAFLRIEDTKCVIMTCKFLPIEKLRPFFDSFQSCFKDDYRFFSGLYFLYRVLILANQALCIIKYSYLLLQVQLMVMLILHGVVQPYKQRKHNIIDLLLFAHMALINALTMFNFTELKSQYGIRRRDTLNVVAVLQAVLITLPLLCAILYCMWIIKKKCFKSNPGNSVGNDVMDYTNLHTAQPDQENEPLLSYTTSVSQTDYNT